MSNPCKKIYLQARTQEVLMIIADWVAVGAVALFILFGLLAGFGKGLKFFTGGIFGVIISVFVCYCLGGLILKLQFVQDLLDKFRDLWAGGKAAGVLNKIHLDLIVYYIALFIVIQIIRVIVVAVLKHLLEIDMVVFKIINKILGALFFLAILIFLTLTVFQIISWVGGETAQDFEKLLEGSFFKLDKLFENNPLLSLRDRISG